MVVVSGTPLAGVKKWVALGLGAIIVIGLTVWGWKTFWFLTDDAYIEFRYASNWLAGRGLTWNPEPFRPVEGYTSLSWVVLLAVAWKVTGIEPPQSAPVLSLLCGLGTLALMVRMGLRMRLPPHQEKARGAFVVVALALVLSNRTFLTWLSSGLETALFNAVFTWWVVETVSLRDRPRWTSFAMAAGACALTRPDGLLPLAGTMVLALWALLQHHQRPLVAAAAPVGVVAVHLFWRRVTYGAWLPNTYYAKHVAAWPEAGLRYLASFLLEYGAWLWLAVAVLWLGKVVFRHWRTLPRLAWSEAPAVVAVSVVLGHVGYYCLVIGGDHFEYRVLSHLVPFLAVSLVFLVGRLIRGRGLAVVALLVALAATLPIQWVHWQETRNIRGRAASAALMRPIASRFPWWAQWYAQTFDHLQGWLIPHLVGMRHQEHKEFHLFLLDLLPTREVGARLPWSELHTLAGPCVGVVGWVLPNVAIIDTLGLNDFVVARSPPLMRAQGRLMAHDRAPPMGYVECFKPDTVGDRRPVNEPRPQPLTREHIIECEERYRRAVK